MHNYLEIVYKIKRKKRDLRRTFDLDILIAIRIEDKSLKKSFEKNYSSKQKLFAIDKISSIDAIKNTIETLVSIIKALFVSIETSKNATKVLFALVKTILLII